MKYNAGSLSTLFLWLTLLLSISACSDESTDSLRKLFVKDAAKERAEEEAKEKEEKKDKVIVRIKRRTDGTMSTRIRYKNGKKHGLAETFYENEKVLASVEYHYGIRQGEAKRYYKNGNLYRKTQYENNEKNGLMTTYHQSGGIKSTVPYKDGQPGIGTKEYYVSGEERSDLPEIVFTRINKLKSEGRYTIEITLSDNSRDPSFYAGELTEGQYFHNDLIMLEMGAKEKGIIDIFLPPNTQVNETINVIAVAKTKAGAPIVLQKKLTVQVSNT